MIVNLRFEIRQLVNPNESIALIGNTQELGMWKVNKIISPIF